jgi:hypothetical protein
MMPLFDDDTPVGVVVMVGVMVMVGVVVGSGDGEAGKAVATAPWPDRAFGGKACECEEGRIRQSLIYTGARSIPTVGTASTALAAARNWSYASIEGGLITLYDGFCRRIDAKHKNRNQSSPNHPRSAMQIWRRDWTVKPDSYEIRCSSISRMQCPTN